MASLLDSMLDTYAPSPRVLTEQHNVNKIAVGSAPAAGKPSDGLRRQIASISAGGWDEAEYGIRAAEQIAKLETALTEAEAYEATPEGMAAAQAAVEKALTEMRTRAINRANLDVTDGKVSVMTAGQAAWHGLGVNVAEAVTWEQANKLSNTEWSVKKEMLYYDHEQTDGSLKQRVAGKRFALVRQDTGKCFDVVSDRYQPIQNREAFQFLDAVLAEYGARFETAGAVDGGKKIWCMVNMPRQAFSVNGDDKVEPYVLFTNAHGGEAAWCFPTSVRTVCANTFRVASQGRRKGICIRHVGNVKNKVAAAQQALGLAVKQFNSFQQAAERMTKTKIQPRLYFGSVLDEVIELTLAEQAVQSGKLLEGMLSMADAERQLAEKSLERKLAKRGAIMEDLMVRYEEENQGKASRGTAWAGWNTVTEFANHSQQGQRRGNGERQAARRFESIIDGPADDMMQAAFRLATAN